MPASTSHPEETSPRRPPDPGGRLPAADQAETISSDGLAGRSEHHPEPLVQTPASVTSPPQTRSYATAVRTGSGPNAVGGIPSFNHTSRAWSADLQAKLEQTLSRTWQGLGPLEDTEEMARLRQIALATAPVHEDAKLRRRTSSETEAFMAYLAGTLELPHPPNFLKSTLTVRQRAVIEQFHETHLEVTLTAAVPPQVRLRRSMTQATLFRELHDANKDFLNGHELVCSLQRDVKQLYFDGRHTLYFVFQSRRLANRYQEIALRLQRVAIELENAEQQEAGIFFAPQLRRRYSLRILGAERLGLATVVGAFSQIAGLPVLDVERPRDASEGTGARYFTVRFNQEDCPPMLRGVTRVNIGESQVTLHHHLLHYRLPCNRCYSPKHTTGFCKLKPESVAGSRNRCTRKLIGPMVNFDIGQAETYRHSDEESLDHFWKQIEEEFEMPADGDPAVQLTTLATVAMAGRRTETREKKDSGHQPEPQGKGVRQDGDYIIVRNKSRLPHSRREREDPTVCQKPTDVAAAKDSRPHDPAPGLSVDLSLDAGRAPREAKSAPPAFHSGQEGVASSGRFHALMDDDSNSASESGSDMDISSDDGSVADDAAYAYPDDGPAGSGSLDATDVTMESVRQPQPAQPLPCAPGEHPSAVLGTCTEARCTESERQLTEDRPESPLQGSDGLTGHPTDSLRDVEMAEETEEAVDTPVSDYIGSSAPSHTNTPGSTPGSEFPYSLASASSDLRSDELAQPTSEVTEMSSQSSDRVVYLHKVGPTAKPVQAGYWLSWFEGKEVKVPDNGQCALLALYATVTNHSDRELVLTADIKRDVGRHKRAIYALLVSNLRADCALGVVDPSAEVARLYPDAELPQSQAVAMAFLCTHMLQERQRPVDAQVPGSFWANPQVLRTYAQYLRAPIVVMDVNAAGDAHAQLYTYSDAEVKLDGTSELLTHETGKCTALTDEDTRDYLNTCGRLHVLPLILILKHHERHFYGVQHGERFLRWQAEGNPTFASEIAGGYEWLHECLVRPAGVQVKETSRAHGFDVDFSVTWNGARVNLHTDTDEVNAILHKALTMRQRLDVAHLRMGWPIMDADELDIATIEEVMEEEEEIILQETGVFKTTALIREDLIAVGSPPRRIRPRMRCRIAEGEYTELLQAGIGDILPEHQSVKLQQALTANEEGFNVWYTKKRATLNEVERALGASGLSELVTAEDVSEDTLRHLFGSLPYPELAAKHVPLAALVRWGRREAYQRSRRLVLDAAEAVLLTLDQQAFCKRWVGELPDTPSEHNIRTMEDAACWTTLRGFNPAYAGVGRPPRCTEHEWAILHVLPYVVRHWRATTMGKTGVHAVQFWYERYPPVSNLCREACNGQWGLAVALPTGLTWMERTDAQCYPPASSYRK